MAAFRRYADRNGVVFVPLAEPLPAGTKGRFALTLSDGGVMIEGDGEVVSAAKTPSVLYGRIGMTVKFLAPDEPSKALLAELEKARLALKPQAPSVAPRPARVPAEPRPRPPVPGGRIDAMNALAECVAIGAHGSPSAAAPPRAASPRFTVPSIPAPAAPTAASRPGTLQVPAIPAPRPPSPRPPTPATGTATTLGIPPLAKPGIGGPTTQATPAAGSPRARTPAVGTTTSLGMAAMPKTTPTEIIAATPPREDPTAPSSTALAPALDNDEPTDLTTIPLGTEGAPEPLASTAPSRPIAPDRPNREPRRTAIGIAVAPRVGPARPGTPAPVPRTETDDDAPATEQMQALVPEEPIEDDGRPTVQMAKVAVEEPTPSGDWTMVPGSSGPTIVPTPRPEKKAPPGPPTGDFIIALDPTRPDGWSEPAKLDKQAESARPGPPVSAVASERPLDSDANAGREIAPETGPKVQIDPTLIEPLQPMPVEDDAAPVAPVPGPYTPVPGHAPHPVAASQAPAYPIDPTRGPALAPSRQAYDAIRLPAPQVGDATSVVTIGSHRRRTVVIAASAGAVLVLGIGLVLAFGGNKDARGQTPSGGAGGGAPVPASAVGSGVAPEAATPEARARGAGPGEPDEPGEPGEPDEIAGSDDSVEPAEPPDDGASEPSAQLAVAPTSPTTSGSCEVDVRSTPSGAEIFLDKATVLGTTPTTLTLPCGVEARLTFKKSRYVSTTRTITPKPDGARPLKVGLAKVTFSIKVSSSPAGATITLGGKTIGVPPTTVKLPAFETSTLKISKPGYVIDTRKVTPKANNLAVHTALKKATRR